jgi:hypothetical protein
MDKLALRILIVPLRPVSTLNAKHVIQIAQLLNVVKQLVLKIMIVPPKLV